ncbi:MAG TPA: hypothetical protein VFQ53_30745 [Kofleriaceae bacterium]|nr:hypothetical protein [Kofleriaceae bacterium]
MAKKRPERTARREAERAAKKLVQDREKLARLVAGGSPERPIAVESPSVIEVRVRATPCPQCEGLLRVDDHRAEAGLRAVDVTCTLCHAKRTLWFKLVSNEPN